MRKKVRLRPYRYERACGVYVCRMTETHAEGSRKSEHTEDARFDVSTPTDVSDLRSTPASAGRLYVDTSPHAYR